MPLTGHRALELLAGLLVTFIGSILKQGEAVV
jgi:hypothetical protein